MKFKVGDIVRPEGTIEHWKPEGRLVVTSVRVGKKTGYQVVTAMDDNNKRFVGFHGAFELRHGVHGKRD